MQSSHFGCFFFARRIGTLDFFLMKSCVKTYDSSQSFGTVLQNWVAIIKTVEKSCVEETKVDALLAERVFAHGEFVDDPNLKCHVRCFSTKLGLFDDQGNLVTEVFKQLVSVRDENAQKEIGEKCFKNNSDDKCERAFSIVRCIYKNVQAILKP